MTKLSPAAQAVLDAFNSVSYYPDENDEGMLAAALRAAADQVMPPTIPCHVENLKIRRYILAIATELEAQ